MLLWQWGWTSTSHVSLLSCSCELNRVPEADPLPWGLQNLVPVLPPQFSVHILANVHDPHCVISQDVVVVDDVK